MSTRPRVVVTLEIADDLMQQLHAACDVTLLPAASVTNPAEFAAALADADGCLLSQPVSIAGPLLDVGLGGIGRTVAQTAKGFDMPVLYYKPRRDPDAESSGLAAYRERDDLFRESDVVSAHCPLNDQTRKSIGAREFALMKPTAFFVNMSRGAVVDQDALVTALREARIAGAALDVTDPEPLDPAHPHIGSGTTDTRRAMHALAVRNLLRALAGDLPETPLNPEVLTSPRR